MKIRKLGLLAITLMSVLTTAACGISVEGEEEVRDAVERATRDEGDEGDVREEEMDEGTEVEGGVVDTGETGGIGGGFDGGITTRTEFGGVASDGACTTFIGGDTSFVSENC